MAANKTQPTDASVDVFVESIENDNTRKDCLTLIEIMQKLAKASPAMWGESIVGFGTYHYRYASGREGDWFLTGFSPRKANLTLYITGCLDGYEEEIKKLGKVKHGKGCIYVKQLDDIHLPTLKKMIRDSIKKLKALEKESERA